MPSNIMTKIESKDEQQKQALTSWDYHIDDGESLTSRTTSVHDNNTIIDDIDDELVVLNDCRKEVEYGKGTMRTIDDEYVAAVTPLNFTRKHRSQPSMTEEFASFRILDYSIDRQRQQQQQLQLQQQKIILNSNSSSVGAAVEPIRPVLPSEMDAITSFWDDCTGMIPGSIPHSTIVGVTIGIVCGIVAYIYYTSLEWLLETLWKTLPEAILVPYIHPNYLWIWIPIVGYSMAFCVGISVKYLGEPGDLTYTVQCVHDKAYIGMDHILPMLCASQFSILGGASLGPEAPLVAICASFAGYISRTLFQQKRKNLIRKHTLMGMSCALAAFFAVPLGGSLFALEVNSRFGIEYYEHTIEAIFSGTVCLCVFRGLLGSDIGPIWKLTDIVPSLQSCTVGHVALGACIGLLGACVAGIFSTFHKNVAMPLFKYYDLLHNDRAIERAMVGSTFVILIGVVLPQTMFWGETEFETLATLSPAKNLPHIFPTSGLFNFEMNTVYDCIIVGIAKLIAISFSVAGGYRGGFIFPFFVTGAVFGRALIFIVYSLFEYTIPIPIATLCFAAGINVSITRTALASTLILSALSGESMTIPPLLAASIVSMFATSYMPFIRSQAKRTDIIQVNTPSLHLAKRNNDNYGTINSGTDSN